METQFTVNSVIHTQLCSRSLPTCCVDNNTWMVNGEEMGEGTDLAKVAKLLLFSASLPDGRCTVRAACSTLLTELNLGSLAVRPSSGIETLCRGSDSTSVFSSCTSWAAHRGKESVSTQLL